MTIEQFNRIHYLAGELDLPSAKVLSHAREVETPVTRLTDLSISGANMLIVKMTSALNRRQIQPRPRPVTV